MANLTTKSNRIRLQIRREPHWQRLDKGAYLGFRRGPDTWHARYRDASGKQHYRALEGAIEYDDAKRTAERWLKAISEGATATIERGTVRAALESYVAAVRESGRDTKAIEMHLVHALRDDCKLADIPLERLTKDQFLAWRTSLKKGRLPRTVNRHVRQVKAGLNYAVKRCGYVGNRAAWDVEALSDDVEANPSEASVFLTPTQRARLIEKAAPDIALFMRGLGLTGARPGELAKATVRDFDANLGKLRLAHRKGDGTERVRFPKLSTEACEFFKAQCRDKLPEAPIFVCSATGRPWERGEDTGWCMAIATARAAVNTPDEGMAEVPTDQQVPKKTTARSFRSTWISEALSLRRIDPVTTAKLAGTSIQMIYKHYAKFIDDDILEKLDAVQGA